MNKNESKPLLEGIVGTTAKGYGFIKTENRDERIVIVPEFLNHALAGDTVAYQILPRLTPKEETQAQVVRIIKRAREQFVGTVVTKEGHIGVETDDRRIYVPFFLEENQTNKSALGKKVLVRIKEWPDNKPIPLGEIVQVIGTKGDHKAEMQSIIIEKGIKDDFPEQVIVEAQQIGKNEREIPRTERATRKDFSETPTFTIDPVDAKDFDDAISIKKIRDNTYEIGVHIADVSHFVRPGTALDAEALERATSIYMVDRVVPMLPEILSNDLCSLNPHEERRVFSAVFEITTEGEVLSRWFGKGIINSHHRFSYESAQDVLDGKDKTFADEMNTLNKIAYKLREKKFADGAIDFDTEEVKFELDENGVPLRVIKKVRGDTHRLVEDFMLLANREVAEYIDKHHEKKGGNGLFRVHDSPADDRLADLTMLYRALGYELKPVKTAKDIRNALAMIQGKPEESLLKTATIRAMAKAIYTTENSGHFGLGFEYYTHFTSPIRRYPDLEVHRILQAILTHNKTDEVRELKRLEGIAKHSTEKEIAAADAERTSIKYKQVEYMTKFVGKEFEGTITGVTDWGIFIEEKNTKCEGMARLRDMKDDYYNFEEKLFRIVGQKTKRKISLGDTVKFRVVSANLDNRTLDYALI